MEFLPLTSMFLLIFLAELGDKTQLAVISLSSNHKWTHAFAGAMLAFLAVDGISLAIGGPLLAMLPIQYVQLISGIVFIVFGVYPLLKKEREDKTKLQASKRNSFPLITCFSLIALMELGDKSQILGITIAAETSPILVLIGMLTAFALLTGIAVFLGAKLLAKLPMKWLKIGTSTLFIVIGVFSILNAVFQISVL